MEALNIPSAANIDKIARRLRSISQRLDEVEDGVEKLDRRLGDSDAGASGAKLAERLDRIESRLDDLGRDVAALRASSRRATWLGGANARRRSRGLEQ